MDRKYETIASVHLISSEWQAIVAITVSVLGLIATLYTAFGSTARRLRRDLTNDVNLANELTGEVKDDLHESITDRSYRLVAATRHPSLTWYEVALASLLAPMLWWLFDLPNGVRALTAEGEPLFLLAGPAQVMVLVIIFVTYEAVVRSWSGRATARVVYIYRRLVDDEARTLVRLLAFPEFLVPTAFGIAIGGGVILDTLAITKTVAWPPALAILISTAV